jgi:Spy/CpxP family protein refolding chaperone
MKKFMKTVLSNIFLPMFVFLAFSVFAAAQQPFNPNGKNPPPGAKQAGRPSLLRELNLKPEQVRQIRLINQETREQMREAADRQRAARRALDAAIYKDNPNEAEVEQRTRELTEAQAALTNLRAKTEFRIRQVLNAEQLARFLELRRRFFEGVEPVQEPPPFPPPGNRPTGGFPNRPQ